jgi:hypothetical protein
MDPAQAVEVLCADYRMSAMNPMPVTALAGIAAEEIRKVAVRLMQQRRKRRDGRGSPGRKS